MTTGIALAAGAAAVGAVATYSAATTQAQAGRAAARPRTEDIDIERQTIALRAREEETERQRRAGLTDQDVVSGAAAMGIDPFRGGSVQQLRGENQRLADADISSVRLLGAGRQRQLFLQGRGAELESRVYSIQQRTAWVRAAGSLVGAAGQAAAAWPPSGSGAGARPTAEQAERWGGER
jgi:hypothetical protein